MQIIEPFKTFIFKVTLKQDLKKIIKFIYKTEKEKKGRVISNFGGFQSNDLNKINPVLVSLIKEIELHANEVGKNVLKFNSTLELDNIWVNVNRFKDFNVPHKHFFSKLSGVFYVKTPKNSGNLFFLNDFKIDHFIRNEIFFEFNQYNSSTFSIEPKENTLYLFPSWMEHYVKPNLSKEERISISFNLL